MATRHRTILAAIALGTLAESSADTAQEAPATPTIVELWPNGAPGSATRRGEAEIAQDYWVRNIHRPSLTIFRPKLQQNGAAIVVIPGGGHKIVVYTTEGTAVGRALNRYGVTVFVLKYRLAREEGSTYSIEGDAAADARRAVRWVRAHAADYGVDPHRVGVMGFSAGGELVSAIADNEDARAAKPVDAIDRLSARPDFQALVFPGPLGIPAHAVVDAPPAFIVAGTLDECCARPAVALYEQLRAANISAELHMYAGSGHAFNLDESNRISIIHWPDRLADWLADEGWLSPRPGPAKGQ
ncbi:MAG TPA: alpha/beta hydrolase [Sphingomonas sp.]|jgi:acetyl esterase/lipase